MRRVFGFCFLSLVVLSCNNNSNQKTHTSFLDSLVENKKIFNVSALFYQLLDSNYCTNSILLADSTYKRALAYDFYVLVHDQWIDNCTYSFQITWNKSDSVAHLSFININNEKHSQLEERILIQKSKMRKIIELIERYIAQKLNFQYSDNLILDGFDIMLYFDGNMFYILKGALGNEIDIEEIIQIVETSKE